MPSGLFNNKMKELSRLCILTTGLLLLFSCHTEELKRPSSLTDRQISLNASKGSLNATLSKSVEKTEEDRKVFLGMAEQDSIFISTSEEEMGVSVMTKADNIDNLPSLFNITVFKNSNQQPYISSLDISSTDSWNNYSPSLYWPNDYEKLHFFAYTSNDADNLFTPAYTTGSSFSATFDYTIPSSNQGNDADLQPDIMFAISPNQNETDGDVNLNFFHTLSAVTFKLGKIGDAEISEVKITLKDILSVGRCTVTHPLEEVSDIVWEEIKTEDVYTHTFREGESFMIIPQMLEGKSAAFEVSINIGGKEHIFPEKALSEITAEWTAGKKYTYTLSNEGYVETSIINDPGTNVYIDEIRIQNTGWTTSYIRAAVVGYWTVEKDGVDEIASIWDLNDSDAGELSRPDDWESKWKEINGIYYYRTPVPPGGYTSPLFESYELKKSTGPVSGSKLKISVTSQAVEKNRAAEVWPIDQLTDSGE